MKISILLPYKENFSPNYAGAVSLFIKDTVSLSKFKKKIVIFGSTKFKKKLLKNYLNLSFKKYFFKSNTNSYLEKFKKCELREKSNLIEIHNRPDYIDKLYKINDNLILYFHNNPNNMKNSNTVSKKISLLKKTKKIIFNSRWTKKQFLKGLTLNKEKREKLLIINQCAEKSYVNFKNKKNLVIFVGRLNKSKGYDLFGNAIVQLLNKYSSWKSIVIGDEPRENISFNHKNLKILGFQKYSSVLNWLSKSKISVVCSRWDEPFGRVALEASSKGCATIISNRGGLKEAAPNSIILNNLTVNSVKNAIEKLIKNSNLRIKLQLRSYKKFKLTNNFISKKIDNYRQLLIKS
mgnify:FL=1